MPDVEDIYSWAEEAGLFESDENPPDISYEDTLEYLDRIEEGRWN